MNNPYTEGRYLTDESYILEKRKQPMTYQDIADKANGHFALDQGGLILAEDIEAYLENGYHRYLTNEEVKYIDWLTDDGS